MRQRISEAFDVVSATAWIAGAIAAIAFGSFYLYSYFNPKYEGVRRETFENSRAFNEGMTRDLENLRLQYLDASPEAKAALRATIKHRFSVYPKDRLPPELRAFYAQIERGQ